MWVRHFRGKRGRPTYVKFAERYAEFRPEDVVAICTTHHEEIHVMYLDIINTHRRVNITPMWAWTWAQANALMEELRTVCNAWLKRKTPGLTPVKFAQPSMVHNETT